MRIIFLVSICFLVAVRLPGQSRTERWRFLPPSTAVSDDPRRVPIPPGPQGPAGTIVLRGGRIFDGTGAAAREGTLVINRNKIGSILPAGSTNWPADAKVYDVAGKTVIPGLIDLHSHLTYADPQDPRPVAASMADASLRGAEHLRYFIESGITSVRDVAAKGDAPFRLKQWVRQNRIPGPRVFPAGQLITGKGGHGDEGVAIVPPADDDIYVALGPEGWREAVREQFKRGADLIKIASEFSSDEVAAAVAEAHDLGLKVTCDCETFYIQRAVEAGVDMIEHPLPRTDRTIQLMAEKHVEADPTLETYDMIFDLVGGYFGSTSRRFAFSKQAIFDVAVKMKKAGIKMGIGTDLVGNRFRFLPEPYIRELKLFVKLGYTNSEVLQIATKTNAELLDMGDKLGTLEPGKLADVTVVDGKPDADLDDLAKVSLVIRDGYLQVLDGRVYQARHIPLPMPASRSGQN